MAKGTSAVVATVSPPTRGWTADGAGGRDRSGGFPAHAGMDLKPAGQLGGIDRFPRPRGDGPSPEVYLMAATVVSPPTRGWTNEGRLSRDDRRGFPAHAGMDPSSTRPIGYPGWFPRPRGDGPYTIPVTTHRTAVSPPTRGWTVVESFSSGDAVGFPAHAGMDRRDDLPRYLGVRFPRPRGDGPSAGRWYRSTRMVSPPTRGWTLGRLRRRPPSSGFPAHAGMDPRDVPELGTEWRFPRPRGDGPDHHGQSATHRWVSPPTRGWTVFAPAYRNTAKGFPAHAGMDLIIALSRVRTIWFPRPRGDGP